MKKNTIDNLKMEGKKVLIRVDFNVPIENGKITSDNRIIQALPTIKKVISSNGKAILFSHLGRIKSENDKKDKSLKIVASDLSMKLNKNVIFVGSTRGPELESAINSMKNGDVLMVENTRFEDLNNNAESKNNPELGKYWASLGDVFINDAFGTAHRAHASNVGIASNIKESAVGYLVAKELTMLHKALDVPAHPFIAIVGGAKVSDKIGVIENLLHKADKVIIGGGMAYTFYKAMGHEIGTSLLEADKVSMAKEFLDKYKNKLILPVDVAVSNNFEDSKRQEIDGIDIPSNMMGLDIGSKSIEMFKHELAGAKTVVWNGPMGVFEFENYKQGTEAIAKAIANQPGVFSIIGGGDSAAAAINLGFADKFSHISTGGGASLEFMEGKPLPGIEAIQGSSNA